MRRLRVGEWVAAISAVGLFITLFFDWFGVDGHAAGWSAYAPGPVHLSGWGSLGWLMDVLLVILILGGLALASVNVRRTAPAWPVGTGVLTWTAGTVIWIALAVRVATQPGLGLGLPNRPVLVEAPAYLGLLFAALIPLGAFLSVRDERTHTRESLAYVPPPPRTAPGA